MRRTRRTLRFSELIRIHTPAAILLLLVWLPSYHASTHLRILSPKAVVAKPPTIHTLAQIAAREVGLKPRLVEAVIYVETHGQKNPATAVSYAGAIGPMQLEPITARYLHVNPWNPKQNIVGGAMYLKQLLHQFNGSLWLALEAYNQGPTAVMDGRTCPAAIAYAGAVIRRMGA